MKSLPSHFPIEEHPLAAQRSIVDGLIRMIRQRDPQTAQHLEAVGILAARTAIAMGLPAAVVARIELAARLHDVGKQTIPIELLYKPGTLSDAEWVQMRLHAHYGAAIVSGFPQLAPLSGFVRFHHERLDGRGYPDGLCGDEIPLESRVISVADAFHAMTIPRPYTFVRSPQAALAELSKHVGAQFDTDVVAAFATVLTGGQRMTRVS